MKQKLLTIKALLVAVLLGVGVNGVWADDITTLPFSKTWTSSDAISPFDAGTINTGTNVTALSVNNTTATAYFDSDAGTDGKQAYTLSADEEVTISLTAYHGWLSGGSTQGVRLKNSQGNTIAEYVYNVGSCNITDVKIGGSTAATFSSAYGCQSSYGTGGANGFSGNGKPYVTTAGYNPVITFKVRYDGYVTLNITQGQRSINNTYTGNLPGAWNVDIAKIEAYANSNNADRTLAINNLSVTSAVEERANYTVKYVDSESNQIDNDAVYSGVVGSTPTLISADKAARYNVGNTKKYVYASDDASSKTIAANGSTVVTVTFTTYEKYDYSVTTSNGVDIESGSLFEDETKTISWSKYIEKEGAYFQATAPFQFTVTKDAKTHEVSVVASQVIQFVETTSSNWATTGIDNANLSGGNAFRGVVAGSSKTMLTVAETGVYSINYAVFSTNTGTGKEFDFSIYKNDASVDANLIETFSVNHSVTYVLTTGTRTINDVILVAGDKIIAKSGNTTCALDYIAIAKTGEATVSKTITSAGWATYCSPYALDFSSAIEHLDAAYIVTGGADGVLTKSEVTGTVPANTGLLLKGEGACAIPVVASSATDVSANKLVGVTANTEIAAEAGYVLMGTGSNGLGFYQNSQAFTVGANTAYLPADFAGAGAPAFFSFDSEATGINAVQGSEFKVNGEYYNLAGQRVAQPTKGLYIVNGKKITIK